jgi:acyl carrier protein
MEPKEVLDELKGILVSRLRFDARRVADMDAQTPLAKGVEGSVGLDSLDFIELSVAIEERFGIAIEETEDLTDVFASLESLCRFIGARVGPG